MFSFVILVNVNASNTRTDSSFNVTGSVKVEELHEKLKTEDVTKLLEHANNLLILSKDTLFSDEVAKTLEEIAVKIQTEVQKESDKLSSEEVWELKAEKTYASWYGDPNKKLDKFHGKKTANGEKYDTYSFTCAVKMKLRSSKFYKFGDILRITNLNNGLSVICRVNDVGSLTPKRTIDLSWASMKALDGLGNGEIPIKVERLVK
jgi:rare lipoprotein A (peptidoglycan hydrolase)